MNSEFSVFYLAAIGGALIGFASGAFYLVQGRIAGISGIFFESFNRQKLWRFAFIIGLLISGGIFYFIAPDKIPSFDISNSDLIIGGLLVGIGTRLGNGCTSGHGICGIARFSLRSVAAVLVFMIAAILVVYFRLHGFSK